MMGNGIRKISLCFAGDAGEISRRRDAAEMYFPEPLDEGLGHSYCYIPQDSLHKTQSPDKNPSGAQTTPFCTISGASISANVYTPLSTDPFSSTSLDKASSFASSNLFASTPLQPVPKSSSVKSGPILSYSGPGSSPIERGFLSGPIERSFISAPLDNNQSDQLNRYRPDSKKRALARNLKRVVSKSFWSFYKELNGSNNNNNKSNNNNNNEKEHNNVVSGSNSGNSSTVTSNNQSSELSSADENDDVLNESFITSQNLQWAEGKSGEDRAHIVISEDHGWVFVGIYDGFNGPDATDFLLTNLYPNVHKELKGLLWPDKSCEMSKLGADSVAGPGPTTVNHLEVLKGLSEALRKTEASYLEIADMMLVENPELALMGSCVLVMVMKGPDVYLMNVGDSRAILAQKPENDDRITNMKKGFESCCQLTMDHSTSIKEEVRRIRYAHRDDALAVINGRVKGSLKVTRAFGAGFLKQPKWNNALLEMFQIDYIGTSPYITCSPSLCHHRLESNDKFLILSSDGLYQYFTNEEAVSEVETFMSTFPEGDPAQHLVKELLFRAAKKAGMDFHQLLDIPQGDRRRYHDDVSIIIISFEGNMWRSSV
ncbi:hypothetical protein CASFOL_027681 [Castilleja foliolosa]|uniref:protein-serine/threonine phosphatase n=1 Tax=Castilleja foliolosa TaxID=1961234 RepID=A0ABD3CFI2_9LAMI